MDLVNACHRILEDAIGKIVDRGDYVSGIVQLKTKYEAVKTGEPITFSYKQVGQILREIEAMYNITMLTKDFQIKSSVEIDRFLHATVEANEKE